MLLATRRFKRLTFFIQFYYMKKKNISEAKQMSLISSFDFFHVLMVGQRAPLVRVSLP